jgi:hypothetical protein
MSNELNILWDSLRGQYGLVLAFTSWVTCLRVVFCFINARLLEFAEHALPAERQGIQAFLNSLGWRVVVFVVNMLTSVKLPTTARGESTPKQP